ncbi:MAG: HigA family addiction module antitoxin [Candidatus Symbiobacter sp.]|nr:HigA family addiction module antitoxin [Candidatus Symbiobacter sp.]
MYSETKGFVLDTPTHPGEFLTEEILAPLELSVTAAARILGVTRPALSSLLNGRSSLSAVMAMRFEKAFGLSMATLLSMQTAYDIAEAQKHRDEINVQPYQSGGMA